MTSGVSPFYPDHGLLVTTSGGSRTGPCRLFEPEKPDNKGDECKAQKDHQQYLHWYLRIYPRTTTPGGFELDVGMSINPSTPEQDAELLR